VVEFGQLYGQAYRSASISPSGLALLLFAPCVGIAFGLNRILKVHHEGIKRLLLVLIALPSLLLALIFCLSVPEDLGVDTIIKFIALAVPMFTGTFLVSVGLACLVIAPTLSALVWIFEGFAKSDAQE